MQKETDGTEVGRTNSHVFGEVAWLISQSQQHPELRISCLARLAMPPILRSQFHIFRRGSSPIGVALWANLSDVSEARLLRSLEAGRPRLGPDDWQSGPHLWLIDLVAPFATPENRDVEVMLADLIAGPFGDKPFKMFHSYKSGASKSIVRVAEGAKHALLTQLRSQITEGLTQ